MISMKEIFSISTLRFSENKNKNKQKSFQAEPDLVKDYFHLQLNENHLYLYLIFPEMKYSVSFIITTIIKLILFMNFQYLINYMTSINYQKITGQNWLLAFTQRAIVYDLYYNICCFFSVQICRFKLKKLKYICTVLETSISIWKQKIKNSPLLPKK